MKSIISKFFIGAALVAMGGLVSCTGDLDQLPKDPNVLTPDQFAQNPKEYLGGILGKCYSSMAVSGQYGPNGDPDIKGMDGGTSQWSRVAFYLEDLPTDVCLWIYQDEGVYDLVKDNWATNNSIIYGAYSRFYTHIAVCNDFIRLTRKLGDYGITVGGNSPTSISQAEIDQFVLEARALRDFSYYYIINWFGRGVVAWDDMEYGEVPPQAESRIALYNKVVADLEDVLSKFPDGQPVYGRIGKDAVEGLLCKFYLNAEVFTGTPAYDKCWQHAQNIIARHKGGGYNGTGLANDYLALFCGNNDMFMPGGSLTAQNEILWGIPYHSQYTEPYGGTMFLIAAPIKDAAGADQIGKGYCNKTWYGINSAWGCMLAREEGAEKFGFVNGVSVDGRSLLWLTDDFGYSMANNNPTEWANGYAPIKFTNTMADANGVLPRFRDPDMGAWRVGIQPVDAQNNWPDTDQPLIRLADIYLMAAEAALRGAAGSDLATALEYVNNIRTRAGLTKWNAAELSLDNLLDERYRELYLEGCRRTDLIRYNKFTGSAYNWTLKGGIQDGTSLPETRNLYPLPSNVIAGYGSAMVQNPGY